MPRVLLINPPSPERLGAPLLGLQYVASALLEGGCEVRVIDAAARYARPDAGEILREAEAFEPHLIGFALFTRWVWHAYRLVGEFRDRGFLLAAGGAHATVRAEETLERGFDIAVEGEAERVLPRVADWLDGRDELARIPGVVFRDRAGSIRRGPPAEAIADLDSLPLPLESQHLFDPRWYHPSGAEITPGGILTSRGCPARCTFCANYVTGRASSRCAKRWSAISSSNSAGAPSRGRAW